MYGPNLEAPFLEAVTHVRMAYSSDGKTWHAVPRNNAVTSHGSTRREPLVQIATSTATWSPWPWREWTDLHNREGSAAWLVFLDDKGLPRKLEGASMREFSILELEDILGVQRLMLIIMIAQGNLTMDRKGKEDLAEWRAWRISEPALLAFLRNPSAAKSTHLAPVTPIRGPDATP